MAFSSGALIVRKPQEYSDGWAAFWLLDERLNTGWATPKGVVSNQSTVIELPDPCVFATLEFDSAHVEKPGRAAKDITVDMSDTSMAKPFTDGASRGQIANPPMWSAEAPLGIHNQDSRNDQVQGRQGPG